MTVNEVVQTAAEELPIALEDVKDGKPLNERQHMMVCALIAGDTLKQAMHRTNTLPVSHYSYLRKNPYYKRLVEYAWESVHDTLFSLVVERGKAGDNKLLLEALKYVGNHLGKIQAKRVELTGANGGPLQIKADYHEERVIQMHQSLRHIVVGDDDEDDDADEAMGWA